MLFVCISVLLQELLCFCCFLKYLGVSLLILLFLFCCVWVPYQSILKEINPKYSLEWLMLKLKLQSFGYLIRRVKSLEKTLMLGKIEGKMRRGQQMMRLLDRLTNAMDMTLSNLWEIVEDRDACHIGVHGVRKRWKLLSNWRTTTWAPYNMYIQHTWFCIYRVWKVIIIQRADYLHHRLVCSRMAFSSRPF